MQPYPDFQPASPPQTQEQPAPWVPPAYWSPPAPWSPPFLNYRRKRLNAKIIAGLILIVCGLAFASIAVCTPWWGMNGTVTISTSSPVPTTIDFYYGQFCEKVSYMGFGGTACIQYFPGMERIANVFAATFFMALGGVIFAILALASLAGGIYIPNARYGLAATGLLASILLIIAPIYIFFGLPDAFNGASGGSVTGGTLTGFFGHLSYSYSGSSMDMNYGGGMGWYLALLAFPLLLVGTVLGTMGIRPARLPAPSWGAPFTPFPEMAPPPAYGQAPSPSMPPQTPSPPTTQQPPITEATAAPSEPNAVTHPPQPVEEKPPTQPEATKPKPPPETSSQ